MQKVNEPTPIYTFRLGFTMHCLQKRFGKEGLELPKQSLTYHSRRFKVIVMTFLVRECYGSPKKQEF